MKQTLVFLLSFMWVGGIAQSKPKIIAPVEGGFVPANEVQVTISKCQDLQNPRILLNDQSIAATFTQLTGLKRWTFNIPLEQAGSHELRVMAKCSKQMINQTIRFSSDPQGVAELSSALIARYDEIHQLEQGYWNWGPAVFLYGLARLAHVHPDKTNYLNMIHRYYNNHHLKGIPTIDLADRCAPVLASFLLDRPNHASKNQTSEVLEFIKSTERNQIGSINHLGTSIVSHFFPDSIWIDSLVMWNLVAFYESQQQQDQELENFSLSQPSLFATYLKDPSSGLYLHAWNTKRNRPLPRKNTFWLRGNGWALAAFGEILRQLPKSHPRYPEIAALFTDLAEATRPKVLPSGLWDTLIANPGDGYEESSGSALLAYSYALGHRLGLLSPDYRDQAQKTWVAITSRMVPRGRGFTMEEISLGTNPSSKGGYAAIGKDRNVSYGVGAFLLLASEMLQEPSP